MLDIEKALAEGFQITKALFFIDKRSEYFFYIQHHQTNYMVLIKEEFPEELYPLFRKFSEDYQELPTFLKESPELMLFKIPDGKLARITEEKITEDLQKQMIGLQEKLNNLMKGSGYNWVWELNYFFMTSRGLMYIDIETIQEAVEASILEVRPYQELTRIEKVLLKIEKEKKKSSQ